MFLNTRMTPDQFSTVYPGVRMDLAVNGRCDFSEQNN